MQTRDLIISATFRKEISDFSPRFSRFLNDFQETISVIRPLSFPPSHHTAGPQGNPGFPLFFQGFPTCAFTEDWGPRSALGAPLGPIGFADDLVLAEMLCFPTFLNDFQVNMSADRPLPRGAPGQPIGFCWFYKGFQHSGRALRGAFHGPAIC